MNACWSDLFVLTAAEHGLVINDEISSMNPHLTHFCQVTKNFSQLKIDEFETACLKALILFRVDSLNALTAQQLSFLQNQILCLLIQKCDRLRFGQLLLLLPTITIAGNSGKLQVKSPKSIEIYQDYLFIQSFLFQLQETFFKESIGDILSRNLNDK